MISKATTKILGVGVILFGSILFGLLLSFTIFIFSREDTTNLEKIVESRYISEDMESLNTLAPNVEQEEVITEEENKSEKQGELVVQEERQILNVGKSLTKEEIADIEEKYSVTFTDDKTQSGIYVLNTTDETDTEAIQEELDADLEIDIPVKISADTVDWGVARIGADKIWSKSTGAGVKVAVLDTGVELTHTDLSANISTGFDFVNNDDSAADDNGHGTHVAGIILAAQNGVGTVGASYSTKVLPVKVLNNQGYGYLSDVAKGIYYAADNGARIINMSLGTPSDSSTLKAAVDYASRKGVIIVAAAGNNSGQPCEYPAAYGAVICVVATDSTNRLASFSNMGGELAAPGVSNYSTYLGNSYRYMSGTSMATPHVAGAAAILASACTTCTSTEIRNLMRETAVDLGTLGQDIVFGYGLVDLVSAMNKISPTIPEEEEVPVEEPTTPPVEETPTKPKPTPAKTVTQEIKITEPVITTTKRYIPEAIGDITLKFTLNPVLSDSTLQNTVVTIDNVQVYETELQTDEYLLEATTLDTSQHWVRVTSTFANGKSITDSIIIDLTHFKVSKNSNKGRSVLGISTVIYDFGAFLFNWK